MEAFEYHKQTHGRNNGEYVIVCIGVSPSIYGREENCSNSAKKAQAIRY